jgi:hypothetical protein
MFTVIYSNCNNIYLCSITVDKKNRIEHADVRDVRLRGTITKMLTFKIAISSVQVMYNRQTLINQVIDIIRRTLISITRFNTCAV